MHNSTLNSPEMKLNGEDLIELETKQANSRNHDKLTRQRKQKEEASSPKKRIKQSVPKAKHLNQIFKLYAGF